jgi:hypothetical protein
MARDLLIPSGILEADRHLDEAAIKEVLNYFVQNRHAADSVEGIARWRLLHEVVRRKVIDTRFALEWLVEHEFLVKAAVTGGAPIFSLNEGKAGEAETFLKELSSRLRKARSGGG